MSLLEEYVKRKSSVDASQKLLDEISELFNDKLCSTLFKQMIAFSFLFINDANKKFSYKRVRKEMYALLDKTYNVRYISEIKNGNKDPLDEMINSFLLIFGAVMLTLNENKTKKTAKVDKLSFIGRMAIETKLIMDDYEIHLKKGDPDGHDKKM